jgi:hypothetical protein
MLSDAEIGCSDMTCGKLISRFTLQNLFFLVMAINQILGYCGASLESWRGGLQLCTRASMPGPLFHGRPWGWLLHLGVVGICGHVGVCLGTDLVRPSPTGKNSAEGDFGLALDSSDMVGEICKSLLQAAQYLDECNVEFGVSGNKETPTPKPSQVAT